MQGSGDAKAAAIYSALMARTPSSMPSIAAPAYKASFKNKSDVMVLDPSADFFRFLKQGSKANKSGRQPWTSLPRSVWSP